MNKVFQILNDAGIGKLKLIWTFINGGWDDLGDIVRQFINHLLGKADAEKLKLYGERFSKTSQLINYAIELFGISGVIAHCLLSTATAFGDLGLHCSDGNYSKDELDKDVDNIRNSIAAWKTAGGAGLVKKAIFAVLGAIAAAAALVAILIFGNGCNTYYENVGTRVRAGSIKAPIELSEPTSSVNVRLLFFLDGVDLYASKGSSVEMRYHAIDGGTWLTSATTQAVEVVVKPVAETNLCYKARN